MIANYYTTTKKNRDFGLEDLKRISKFAKYQRRFKLKSWVKTKHKHNGLIDIGKNNKNHSISMQSKETKHVITGGIAIVDMTNVTKQSTDHCDVVKDDWDSFFTQRLSDQTQNDTKNNNNNNNNSHTNNENEIKIDWDEIPFPMQVYIDMADECQKNMYSIQSHWVFNDKIERDTMSDTDLTQTNGLNKFEQLINTDTENNDNYEMHDDSTSPHADSELSDVEFHKAMMKHTHSVDSGLNLLQHLNNYKCQR